MCSSCCLGFILTTRQFITSFISSDAQAYGLLIYQIKIAKKDPENYDTFLPAEISNRLVFYSMPVFRLSSWRRKKKCIKSTFSLSSIIISLIPLISPHLNPSMKDVMRLTGGASNPPIYNCFFRTAEEALKLFIMLTNKAIVLFLHGREIARCHNKSCRGNKLGLGVTEALYRHGIGSYDAVINAI